VIAAVEKFLCLAAVDRTHLILINIVEKKEEEERHR